jgi:transposase InsO family protein
VTSIRLQGEFLYLAVLMDVFTRCVHGWHFGRRLNQALTLAALERALRVAPPQIHPSNPGMQGVATAYIERLQKRNVMPGMAALREPGENGYAERLLRTISAWDIVRNLLEEVRSIGTA